jgi:hypothetical protein
LSTVYYFCDREKLDLALRDGLMIKDFADRKIGYKDMNTLAIAGYLNPQDNKQKKNDMQYVCLELSTDNNTCYATDKDLFESHKYNPLDHDIRSRYYKSLISLEKYRYGQYRVAEVLIHRDVAPANIKLYSSKDRGIVNFSDEFNPYYGCLLEEVREEKGNEYIIYLYCEEMVNNQTFEFVNEIDLPEGNVRIYYDRIHQRCIDVLMRREWQRNAL